MSNLKMQSKTAQLISDRVSEILGYSVLVTDDEGVIIGCAERNRIGTLHRPSIEAMKNKSPALTSPEEAALSGVRPGYTAPVIISGNVVGSISISGLPQKVERYGLLVQRQAEILMMEQSFMEVRLRRQLALRDLAESIMLYRPEDSNADSLLLHGRELGFDLENCHIAAMIEYYDRRSAERPERSEQREEESFRDLTLNRVVNFFDNPLHLITNLRDNRIVILFALPCSRHIGEMEETAAVLCERLAEHLAGNGVDICAGIGYEADNVRTLAHSAHIAREAMSVGRALGMRICPAGRLSSEMLLSYLPPARKRQHIDAVMRGAESLDQELTDTFMAWCRNPFAMGNVAKELSIHRNTLKYRLEKLKNLLGLDPRNFHDCFAIWSALTLKKFEKN